MPNTKSAQKRQRSNEAKTARNTTAKSRVRTMEKKFRTLASEGDKEGAASALQVTFSALDKAAKNGVIHKATANRKKSRLAKVAVAG